MNTEAQTETLPILFGEEFQELFNLARPSMNEYLIRGVEGMVKSALKQPYSRSHQENLYKDCLDYMAHGLDFAINRKSESMGTPEEHIRRLKRILDDLK